MTVHETTLSLPDGRKRPLTVWEPRSAPRGLVLGLHAYGDNRHGFAALGPRFAAERFRVWAYDHQGFGVSDIRSRSFPGVERLVDDCAAAAAALQASAPGLPLVLTGESMGGGVAIVAAATGVAQPKALLLAAPAVRGAVPYRYAYNVGLWIGSTIAPWLGATVNRDLDQMHPLAAERFGESDRVIRFVTIGDYYGIIRVADRAADAAPDVRAPVFVAYGTDDRIVPAVAIRAFAKTVPSPVEVKTYEGGPHGLLQWSGHTRVETDMLTFLGDHVR
jgi:alpha-beta hydrolase superfamily lysophospholipase